ncbi:MAG TPA: SDR family NAD(P)-dependent oxidoreductase, partial [Feifaniaceae bacterium]|nr:SDR family NAD(P)-dependent oxidoreductase [Feifaniaceae bacterium]
AMLLKDKIAIVTGAAQGIGFAIARMYAQEGAVVVIGDVNADAARASAKEIADETGRETPAYALDISSKDSVNDTVDAVVRRYGRIDILVNNAGICPHAPLLTMDDALWDKVYAINVRGTFLMTQAVGNYMVKARQGKIINISSCSGKKPTLEEAAYCSSKSAVIGLTRVTALELGIYGVTCNAICPGATDSQMLRSTILTSPEIEQEWINKTALKRLGQPEDQARVAVFLGSELSNHMTGESLIVSAGEIMTQ